MNIFSLFSNAMSVASKVDSAPCRVDPAKTEGLINELCDAGRAQSNKSDAFASDATFKGSLPYPS